MRNLEINKKSYIALNYLGVEEVEDEQGNKTGEKVVKYSKPIPFRTHLSGASGSVYLDSNGVSIEYDKTMVLTLWEFEKLKFTENTVFFIDTKPKYDNDKRPLYDYRVARIRDTLNEVVILLKKVRNN